MLEVDEFGELYMWLWDLHYLEKVRTIIQVIIVLNLETVGD